VRHGNGEPATWLPFSTRGNRRRHRVVLRAMTNLRPFASARPAPSPRLPLASIAIVVLIAAGCGSAGATVGPGGSGGPTTAPTPTATPVIDGIQHPTGARDVILRVSTSGGFAPVEFLATSAPSFTLYGDGTVVFRDPTATPPDPLNNVNRLVPFVTIHLGEEAIQAVLSDAIGPGGLGIAIGPYMGHVADLPSTDFVITADGRTKTVSVTGMSADMQDPQNAGIVTALAGLAERLDHFGNAVSGEELYTPAAYRGVLNHADQAFGPVIPWPWATVKPTDFKGENDFLLKRTMTPAEIDALGIPGITGGFSGVTLQTTDGKLYTFSLRPLLPDEAE
jgi:hypothetical protein